MSQGLTGSDGRLTALGVDFSDFLVAAGSIRSEGALARGTNAAHERWLYGEATVGASGVSRMRNSFTGFGTDSLVPELKVVEGDYPLLVRIDYSASTPRFSLIAQNMFSAIPTLDHEPQSTGPSSSAKPTS